MSQRSGFHGAALSKVALSVALLSGTAFVYAVDYGAVVQRNLNRASNVLFGFGAPVPASSTLSIDQATADADPTQLMTVANGLTVRVAASSAAIGANVDMIQPWPANSNTPTHLIFCNEEGSTNPGIQRVELATGAVTTMLTGTVACDPLHATPWGTIIAGEEAGSSGNLLEIIDPLNTEGVVYDRVAHTLSGDDAANVAERPALGHLSFEGVGILPNGVVYYGDELRPSSGTAGGAYFKFIPTTLRTSSEPITTLSESPLADGQVYGLRLGKRGTAPGTDYGQGNNTGFGSWIAVTPSNNANLTAAAATLKLTGFYRPEDLSLDQAQLASGNVRFCANNTGNEGTDHNWGETICVTDGTVDQAAANTATPTLQFFVMGTPELAMADNIAYQPVRGNWIIHEDGDQLLGNNDIWACLEDGSDFDHLSDGCVRFATLNDLNAETSGGVFTPNGKRFFVSVQHNVTGHGIILEISGWRVPRPPVPTLN